MKTTRNGVNANNVAYDYIGLLPAQEAYEPKVGDPTILFDCCFYPGSGVAAHRTEVRDSTHCRTATVAGNSCLW